MPAPLIVFCAGLVLAWCAVAVRRASGGRVGRGTARQTAGFLIAAVAFLYAGLGLLVASAALPLLPAAGIPAVCRRTLARLDEDVPGLGWLAAGCLVVSVWLVVRRVGAVRRQRRDLHVEAGVGMHQRRPRFDLVTLPCVLPVAYSLSGRRGQVVVSEGLRARLDPGGFAAVLAHEEAHLRARHDWWLTLAGLLDAALWFVPRARAATGTLRLSVECWADAEAAREVGPSALRAALLAAAAVPAPPYAPALSGAGGSLAHRLAALSADAVPAVRPVGGRVLGLVATAAVGAGLAAALAVLAHVCGG